MTQREVVGGGGGVVKGNTKQSQAVKPTENVPGARKSDLNPPPPRALTLSLLFRKEYDDAVEKLAEFVGAEPKNLVFVNNATTAVNTVVKNLHLEPEDIILLNSHTYGVKALFPPLENKKETSFLLCR